MDRQTSLKKAALQLTNLSRVGDMDALDAAVDMFLLTIADTGIDDGVDNPVFDRLRTALARPVYAGAMQ